MSCTRATTRGQAELAARWLAWSSAVLRARGDRAGAARAAERAREELTALGVSAAVAMVQLGFVALHDKAFGDAGGWFGRVLGEASSPEDLAQLARAGLLVATADAEQWDLWEKALGDLEAAMPPTDDPGSFPTLDPDMAATLDLAAVTALQRGEVARARQTLKLAHRHHLARRDEVAASATLRRLAGIS